MLSQPAPEPDCSPAAPDAWDALDRRSMILAELRDLANLTQAELAERLDVVQSAVAKFEGTRNPTLGRLRKVVAGMGGEMAIVVRLPGEEPIRLDFRNGPARPRRKDRPAAAASRGR